MAIQPSNDSKKSLYDNFRPTDVWNALRLVSLHGDEIRYAGGSWHVWNGKIWDRGNSKIEIMRRAKNTAEKIHAEAKREKDPKKSIKLERWAERSQNIPKLNAMIKAAESESAIEASLKDFDANQWLLNVENGTIDLTTGAFYSHRKEDLISKISPVEYSKGAQCPEWNNFISSIMGGNEDLQKYLKRIIGYSLTGDTQEQCLFFLYGKGSNGKSTFIEVIKALLAEYAQQTGFNTFLSTNKDSVKNDLAQLWGARFVSGSEAEQGNQFSEVFIKTVTGQDTLVGKFLYHEPFQFKGTFKIFLAGNHRPVIKGTDHGIWRRIRLIPYNATFEKENKTKGLAEKLKDELPGILNWAIEGCLEWQDKGLKTPKEIILATKNYRKEMDVIGIFLEDCCRTKAGTRTSKGDMHDAYSKWCKAYDKNPLIINMFGKKMKERGTEESKSGDIRYWVGIELLPEIERSSNACTNHTIQPIQENVIDGDYRGNDSDYWDEFGQSIYSEEETEEDEETEPYILSQEEIDERDRQEKYGHDPREVFTQEELDADRRNAEIEKKLIEQHDEEEPYMPSDEELLPPSFKK